MMKNYKKKREIMLREHLGARGIDNREVLQAMYKTPREKFVGETFKDLVYEDRPLPIGSGQTISQPYIVALMTMNLDLKSSDKVLEIGTGCGYQTAVLANFGCKIYTVERIEGLYKKAISNLQNISLKASINHILGDGTVGAIKFAPFDKIVVTAGAPNIVKPLLKQLAVGGVLIIPEGNKDRQILKKYIRYEGKITVKDISYCKFVPLIGKNGWAE